MTEVNTGAAGSYSAEVNESQNMAACAKQSAEEALEGLKERAADYLDIGRDKALALAELVEEQIRQRPVQSLSVAAGIGFAVGLLWSRRK
jgi:ElaB/YqjD/DUF883 family membrane-anchored ribosome-binding protein